MGTHLKPGQSASDNAGFDVHQTDPARLKMRQEVHKDLGIGESKAIRWKCNQCGDDVKSATRPQRCTYCGNKTFLAQE